MIPAIGFMVGAYIIFRMVEVLLFNPERYSSKSAHAVLGFLALVVILFTVTSML
jgi:hypothetical protein